MSSIISALLALPSPHRFSICYDRPALLGSHPTANELFLSAPHKLLWDHWTLPRRLHRLRPDVVWYPQNILSLGWSGPTVLTVTDLLYFPLPEFPHREYAWLDTLYARLLMPRSLRTASRIMAISEWTRRDILRLFRLPPEKIRTIHLAPSPIFRTPPDYDEAVQLIRGKYGLETPYFLYSGILSPRKNIEVVVRALGQLRDAIPHLLLATGGPGFRETPLDDLLHRTQLSARFRRLGVVPAIDLRALYRAAEALVFPSLYEGFGLPPLEAFLCHCPVISSSATSLPEVVGDAALLFEPTDVDALARHLWNVATDRDLRNHLIHAGLRRAEQFDYRRTARALLDLMEEVAT